VRDFDLIARIGGDEFVVVMPDASAGVAAAVAERLRKRIAAQPFQLGHGIDPLQMTVSIGCASAHGEEEQPESLLKRADEALYRAKRAGRNQVVTAGPSPPPAKAARG